MHVDGGRCELRFLRDDLGGLARSVPLGVWFIRTVDGVDLNDPVAAAHGRPVFELQSTRGANSMTRTLRSIMAVAALSLLGLAALHSGLVIPGPFNEARCTRSSVAVVLVVGIS